VADILKHVMVSAWTVEVSGSNHPVMQHYIQEECRPL